MSAPVDVLAVMDRAEENGRNARMKREMREARAAVAELIEAAASYRALAIGRGMIHSGERLDAALARIGGGQ